MKKTKEKVKRKEGVFIALHKCLLASSLRGRELPTLSHQFLHIYFIVFISLILLVYYNWNYKTKKNGKLEK